ncbi:MAG: hypothetical protein ACXWQQ_03965 [Pseudobdellovibrio sp.]
MILTRIQKRSLVTIVVLGILFGASCLKKSNLMVEDLGTAVSAEDVANTLDQAFGPIAYGDMKSNEMTDIVVSQRVEEGAVQNLEEQNITIQSIVDQTSSLEIKSHTIMTSFASTGNVVDERDWDQVFPKYSGFAFSTSTDAHQAAGSDLSAPIFTFKLVQSLAMGSCYDGGTYPESCYNLTTTDLDYPAPVIAAPQLGCSDPYNCTVKAKQIEFDMLQKYVTESDGSPRRIHYTLIISSQVPFTSRVLKYCTRALYDIAGVPQKVLADICYDVNKYSFGQ